MKAARLEARLSSAALSRRLSKNDQWATQVESGHGSPDPELLVTLAAELGRSVSWLLTGAESGHTEFMDALSVFEPRLDSRARASILTLAEAEAARYEEVDDEFTAIERTLLASGIPAEEARRAVEAARASRLPSGPETAIAPAPLSGRGSRRELRG